MNSELIDTLKYAFQKKAVRVVLAAFVLILLSLSLFHLFNRVPTLSVAKTNLNNSNFISLQNGKLLSYNGLSFLEVDPSSNSQPKVIATPKFKMPTPSSVIWASENGVLLNFRSGIIHSPIEDYIVSRGDSIADNYYGTWYFDFSKSELKFVDEGDFNPLSTIYSPKDSGFYYISNAKQSDIEPVSILKFYDIKNNKTSTIASKFNITTYSMNLCDKNGASLCAIGRDDDQPYGESTLYTISRIGDINKVFTYEGETISAPNINQYITLTEGSEHQEIDMIYKKIIVTDISNTEITKKEYPATMFADSLSASYIGKSIFLIDSRNDEYVVLNDSWLSNNTQTGKLIINKDYDLKKGINAIAHASDANTMLVTSPSGQIYTIRQSKSSQIYEVKGKESIEQALQECTSPNNSSFDINDNSITLLVGDDDNFNKNLNQTKECLSKPELLYGYSYGVRGVSPENGRISTD